MREILFRGKTTKGIWIEGFYCPCCFGYFPCRPAIIDKNEMDKGCWKPEEIIPETLSQYTGLTDKNGNKIFEGDILSDEINVVSVIWNEYSAEFQLLEQDGYSGDFIEFENILIGGYKRLEIIGNIHDNPELLGGEK